MANRNNYTHGNPEYYLIIFHSGIGICRDYESWVDIDGYGCNGYGEAGCKIAANYVNSDGIGASSACCICGGGNSMIISDSLFCNYFNICINISPHLTNLIRLC